jgi:UDP-N-acetylmuramate dehydrogenase
MNFLQNVSLAGYSTMGLGGAAAYMVEIRSRQEVPEALAWAKARQAPAIMIGGGSNIIWGDAGYAGLVMVNKIPGYEVQSEDAPDFI